MNVYKNTFFKLELTANLLLISVLNIPLTIISLRTQSLYLTESKIILWKSEDLYSEIFNDAEISTGTATKSTVNMSNSVSSQWERVDLRHSYLHFKNFE